MHRFPGYSEDLYKEDCFNINNKFRDVRLSTDRKVKELQNFINLFNEYKIRHPESDLSELKLRQNINDLNEFISEYTQYDKKLKYAVIRGMHGRFLSSQNGGGSMTAGDRPVPLGWEIFAFEVKKNGKFAIKSCCKYVSSENGIRDIRCNRKNAGASELFDLIEHENGIYSFKGNNGKYISSPSGRNTITCDSDGINENEKFNIQWMNDLTDEINISWTYYEEYFTRLCTAYVNGVEAKKKINPDNYFVIDELEVNDPENPHFTRHRQQIFDHRSFKEAMQKIDKRINEVKSKLEDEKRFLRSILGGENWNNDRITRMLNSLASAYTYLSGKFIPEIPNDNESNEEFDDYVIDDEMY